MSPHQIPQRHFNLHPSPPPILSLKGRLKSQSKTIQGTHDSDQAVDLTRLFSPRAPRQCSGQYPLQSGQPGRLKRLDAVTLKKNFRITEAVILGREGNSF